MTLVASVESGRVYDLSIRFGNQVRTKCARCKHFMRVPSQPEVTCGCGQHWIPRGAGRFEAKA